jgi:butirosin biosynthesis protein H-like/uncharacterized protein DUF4872
MSVLLHPAPHVPGRHCASSALRDVAHFAGHPLDEALCFGLAAGLGFTAIANDTLSPSRQLHGRAHDLEARFFRRLGIDFAWRTTADAAGAWRAVRAELDAGRPVLAQADLHHLPYYGSRTHFGGHVIGVWGYDDAAGVAFVGDTQFPGLQAVPLDALAAARTSPAPPLPLAGNWFPGVLPAVLPPLERLIVAAVAEQAAALLDGTVTPGLMTGVAGMAAAADTLPAWGAQPDAGWCARFTYQLIERRGSGGGAFRLLYRDFLTAASAYVPSFAALVTPMEEIAARWTELALLLKDASEQERPDLRPAAPLLATLARAEESVFGRAVRLADAARTR